MNLFLEFLTRIFYPCEYAPESGFITYCWLLVSAVQKREIRRIEFRIVRRQAY